MLRVALAKDRRLLAGCAGVVYADGFVGIRGTGKTLASLIDQLTRVHRSIQTVGVELNGPPLDACHFWNLPTRRLENFVSAVENVAS